MNFRTAILALILISFAATLLFAEEAKNGKPVTQVMGANSYGATTLETIQGAGLVKLNGTTVQNNLQVTGSLIATHAEIGSLEVSGDANLTDSILHQTSSVTGSLRATHSTFEKPLTLLVQKAVFTACTLDAVTVLKDLGYKGKQTLELKQKTLINGGIHFEGGKGEVLVFPGSQVLGPVTGGKVIKKS